MLSCRKLLLASIKTDEVVLAGYARVLRAACLFAPGNPKLISKCSRLLRRCGDLDGALALIERALALAPQERRLLEEHLRILRQITKAQRAEGRADRTLALIGSLPHLLAARAAALHDVARYQEARDAWQKIVEQDPLEPHGWAGMAKTLYAMGRPAEIAPLINEYLGMLGNRPERFLRAAHVAMLGRQWAILADLLARAEGGAREDPAGLRAVANLHLKAGNVGRALDLLDDAGRLAPEDRSSRRRRKDALHMLRLVRVDPALLEEAQRAMLRMPDLALVSLIERGGSPRKSRPGHLAMICSSLGPGGAQRQVLNTVHGLHVCGAVHQVTLMPLIDDDPELHRFHAASFADLSVTMQPTPGGRVEMDQLRRVLGPGADDLFALLPGAMRADIGVLATRFLEDPPEVVHAWGDRMNIAAGVAAAIAGVPRVILSDRSVAADGSRSVPNYYRTVYKALLARPDTVLVNNSSFGARSYAEWLGIDCRRIRVVYNGVDTAGLERARDLKATASHRRRLGLPDEAKIIGSLFRLSREKRPLLWLEAAAEVVRCYPVAHFVILGEGPMRGDMEAAARALGIADRLHMPGLTREVVSWYDLMDVVLLTSMYEGTSNTALEAQALGIPVVSTAVGGMPETFAPGVSGFLVDADPSPEAIAECVVRALTDQEWRNQARAAAQTFIRERFSLERMIRDTLQVYDLPASEQADEPRPDGAESVTGQVA